MRRTALRWALVAALFGWFGSAPAQRAAAPGIDEDIRELMVVTGAKNLGNQMLQHMLGPMKQAMPHVPEEFWTRMMAKFDTGEVMEMAVPIYAKHFTHEEIQQLLAFYKTPLGEKLIASLPAIMEESMAAGQKWGEAIGEQIFEELKAEGYYE